MKPSLLPNLGALNVYAFSDVGAHTEEKEKSQSFRSALNNANALGETVLNLPTHEKALRHIRPNLFVDHSDKPECGLGLFTSETIEAGGFIGFFTGIFCWESDCDGIFKASEKCIQTYGARWMPFVSPSGILISKDGHQERAADRLIVIPRINADLSEGDQICSVHYDPKAEVSDVLALLNHGPTEPEGQLIQDPDSDVLYANVKLESVLLPIRNPNGELLFYPCICAFAIDEILFHTELLIDYVSVLLHRVKFKPRHRHTFSRLQNMTSQLCYDEARNQGLRVQASMTRLGMECSLVNVVGPPIRDVPEERSSRTGAVLLEAKMDTVLDRSKSTEEVAAVRINFRSLVLYNEVL